MSGAQIAADAIDIHRAQASSRSIDLRLASQEVPEVWADRERILQVFDNLIGNSLKFTAPGGCITVGMAPRDAAVLFWVADTGSGIALEDQPHIFDRFWQARATQRTGAGLGLAIVKSIVEAHGGSVWVDSVPGRGSTFFFTIPTASVVTAAVDQPTVLSLNGGQQVLRCPDLRNVGGCARAEGFVPHPHVVSAGDNDDLRPWNGFLEVVTRLQSAACRHEQIDDDDIGPESHRCFDQLADVGDPAHDFA